MIVGNNQILIKIKTNITSNMLIKIREKINNN
jgi:hypothetical protein